MKIHQSAVERGCPGSNVVFLRAITRTLHPWGRLAPPSGNAFSFYCQLCTSLEWETNKVLINFCRHGNRFCSRAAVCLESGWNCPFISTGSPIRNHGVAPKVQTTVPANIWDRFSSFNIIGNSNTVYPKKEMIIHLIKIMQSVSPYFVKVRFFFPIVILHIIGFGTIVTKNADISNANLKCRIWFSAQSYRSHTSTLKDAYNSITFK